MMSIHTYDHPIHTIFFACFGRSRNDLYESTARHTEASLQHERCHMTSTDPLDRWVAIPMPSGVR